MFVYVFVCLISFIDLIFPMLIFSIYLSIDFTSWLQHPFFLSFQSHPYKFLSPNSPALLLTEGEVPLRNHPALGQPVTAGLSASSSTEAQTGSPVTKNSHLRNTEWQRSTGINLLTKRLLWINGSQVCSSKQYKAKLESGSASSTVIEECYSFGIFH
jgi:hypothetical protein